jgi:hypothetical protein
MILGFPERPPGGDRRVSVAIAIYWLIGWGIVSLIRMMTRPRGTAGV